MKKNIKFLVFLFVLFSFCYKVEALDYQQGSLIPVNTSASVNTEMFYYQDFVFNNSLDSKGNGNISFTSITNNTDSKQSISIDLLLFDESQKNIGYVTYCSTRDISSDYAGMMINSKASVPFSISVNSKYFPKDDDGITHNSSEVKYISVLDDNKYCKVGGYDKYLGLTFEEISKGVVKADSSEKVQLFEISSILENNGLMSIIIMVLVLVGIYIIIGLILNALYKRMFAKTTPLAYLPLTNLYICMKLAFGNLVATIYIIVYILSFAFTFVNLNFLIYIFSFITSIAFIVDIIKLITKKYDLFYFEPSVNNQSFNSGYQNNSNYQSNNNFINNNFSNDNNKFDDNSQSTFVEGNGNEVLDLSYNDTSDDLFNNSNNMQQDSNNFSNNISTGSFNNDNLFDNTNTMNNNLNNSLNNNLNNSMNNNLNNSMNNNLNNTNSNNSSDNDNGESDLSKFFR
jgi:hypothetical protein